MSAAAVLDDTTLAKARDLLHSGKKVRYIATRLNVESAVIIEAGLGHGLRYDHASDTMTARPAALDVDPNSPTTTLELGRYRKTTQIPARLLPPRSRTPVEPKKIPAQPTRPSIARVPNKADLERCYDRVCADIADTRDRLRDLLIVQQALHTLLPRRNA